MTLTEIAALAAAGFTKQDIMTLVTGYPVQQPTVAQPTVAQPVQQPTVAQPTVSQPIQQPTVAQQMAAMQPGQTMDMTNFMQSLYAQNAQMDIPPVRSSEDILKERFTALYAANGASDNKGSGK